MPCVTLQAAFATSILAGALAACLPTHDLSHQPPVEILRPAG